jgi:hypothetical protein
LQQQSKDDNSTVQNLTCTQLLPLLLLLLLLLWLQLLALDLSGLVQVSDSLAPTLAQLQQLVVLQLSHTSCSDATVEWLTYGSRLHEWQRQQQQQGGSLEQLQASAQLSHSNGDWHRCAARRVMGVCQTLMLTALSTQWLSS